MEKWYFRTSHVITAFLLFGPLALPLVWFNPRYSKNLKIKISAITLILSFFLGIVLSNSIQSIIRYYEAVFQGFPR